MGKVKVRYSVEERLTYSGVIEIDREQYEDMLKMDDDALGELILDMVDRRDPQDWFVGDVDEFELVKE